ncbi:hypothetical protein [Dactylosporangium sp. NPDC000521]|uniref:hypothetical protein n=1 Tax=Dactylosporangium sp. NPDC000521 TaxID=3363975 RepID=UPI0036822CB9
MTTLATNVADGNANVGVQAETIHGNVYTYQLAPDASPEETFRTGVRYLDARMPTQARELIETAVVRGYETDEVQFHRLLALLSGRTLRQLGSDEFDSLAAITDRIVRVDGDDGWSAGLRVMLQLLDSANNADVDVVLKELIRLHPEQRDRILDHLGVLLEGPIEDQLWRYSIERAEAAQTANAREGRIWKFFQPSPAPPRVAPVQPAAISAAHWIGAALSTAVFTLAAGNIGRTLLQHGAALSVLAFLLFLAGTAGALVTGVDWHFRRQRLLAKEAEYTPPRHWIPEPPADGFTRKVDQQFSRYFALYVPRDTDRATWLAHTAGIRRSLRNEITSCYRESRIGADRIAWLIRHLVSDVRRQWERGAFMAYRTELRTPWRTIALCIVSLVTAVVAGLYSIAAAAFVADPFGWALSVAAVLATAATGTLSVFHIVAERRRVQADSMDQQQRLAARQTAFEAWQQRLADKPTDAEMAVWLDADRRLLVDAAMRHYRLRPSQVIAHTFIEAPARSYERARVRRGPWRYSRYQLLLFLLTDDGVRQVDIELDFKGCTSHTTQRLNYRFDAVAAVRVHGVATDRQVFELTLVNGNPITVRVTESGSGPLEPGEDAGGLARVSLDASGLMHTLNVLEGIAAEGKEWIRHQRRRADERLADLTTVISDLME